MGLAFPKCSIDWPLSAAHDACRRFHAESGGDCGDGHGREGCANAFNRLNFVATNNCPSCRIATNSYKNWVREPSLHSNLIIEPAPITLAQIFVFTGSYSALIKSSFPTLSQLWRRMA